MPRTQSEMWELVSKLLAEYSEFQRRRPDVPQGNLRRLSQSELEELVDAFQRDASRSGMNNRERPDRVH
jgi:hypothetical protein